MANFAAFTALTQAVRSNLAPHLRQID